MLKIGNGEEEKKEKGEKDIVNDKRASLQSFSIAQHRKHCVQHWHETHAMVAEKLNQSNTLTETAEIDGNINYL